LENSCFRERGRERESKGERGREREGGGGREREGEGGRGMERGEREEAEISDMPVSCE
jgi:hypothetical protein